MNRRVEEVAVPPLPPRRLRYSQQTFQPTKSTYASVTGRVRLDPDLSVKQQRSRYLSNRPSPRRCSPARQAARMSSASQSNTLSDPQTTAQDKFNELSFFLLSNLPPGSEFGIDSKLWTVNKFGVRSSCSPYHSS